MDLDSQVNMPGKNAFGRTVTKLVALPSGSLTPATCSDFNLRKKVECPLNPPRLQSPVRPCSPFGRRHARPIGLPVASSQHAESKRPAAIEYTPHLPNLAMRNPGQNTIPNSQPNVATR